MLLEANNTLKAISTNFGYKRSILRSASRRFIDPVTLAALIGGGGQLIGSAISAQGSKEASKLQKVSTMNRDQKALFVIAIANVLGIEPSILAENPKNLQKLVQSGQFDDLIDLSTSSPEVQKKVFQGDRVADLTDSQKDLITGALTSDLRGLDARSAFSDLRAERGLSPQRLGEGIDITAPTFQGPQSGVGAGIQPLGEDGAEVIQASEDIDIVTEDQLKDLLGQRRDLNKQKLLDQANISIQRQETAGVKRGIKETKVEERNELKRAKIQQREADRLAKLSPEQALLAPQASSRAPVELPSQEFNPLATESNTIGADPDELLAQTGLIGLADGGALNEDEKAVVGEEGTEFAIPKGTLENNIQQASNTALSGTPSSQINKETTDQFIQSNIVDPANQQFTESTLPSIAASTAGAGFLGSQKVKATQRASDLSNRNILEQSSSIRFQDEQARRGLAESAANRASGFVPTALNVQNQDIARAQGQANVLGTQAGTAQTEFGTQRGQALLPFELASADIGLDQALANVDITDENRDRISGLIDQDLAQTGQIEANTEATLREAGMTEAQIQQIKANTDNLKADFIRKEQEAVAAQNAERINTFNSLLNIAGIEQDQNQAEINAIMQEFMDGNQALADTWGNLMALIGEQTQAIG